MTWYYIVALASLGICLFASLYHLTRLIRLGKPADYAPVKEKTGAAVVYSFTGAMSPAKKESAFLHLPTYTAGILYHLGTFLSILLFFLFLFGFGFGGFFAGLLSGFLVITGLCGIGVFIKRMVKPGLRHLSSPDDYISNLLVTLFQLATVMFLLYPGTAAVYFIMAALLLLYFPMGKLKHAIYFFAARYHLGLFYGRRGVWPPKTI